MLVICCSVQMTYWLLYAYLYCVLRHICHIYVIAVLFQMALTDLFRKQTSKFTLNMCSCQRETRQTWHNYKETYLTNCSRARFARANVCQFIIIKTKNGLLKSKYCTLSILQLRGFARRREGFTLMHYVVYVFYTDMNYEKGMINALKFAAPISKCFRRP